MLKINQNLSLPVCFYLFFVLPKGKQLVCPFLQGGGYFFKHCVGWEAFPVFDLCNVIGGCIDQFCQLGLGNMLNAFGVDVFSRLYPFGKVLYFGVGLGFHGGANGHWKHVNVGFGLTPEIGVKIDPGRKGAFFMEIGYKNPLVFGGRYGFYFNTVPCFISFGGAF